MSIGMDKTNGIIFDMDNTILASCIDFPKMKQETRAWVSEKLGRPTDEQLTVGETIAYGAAHGLSPEEVAAAWQLVGEIEAEGMVDALAEAGAADALIELKQKCYLTVLTNNAKKAANLALERAGLQQHFPEIWAREDVPLLKPDPQGVEQMKAAHPEIQKWLLIGDSWLDGAAAKQAGIGFAAYGDKPAAYWQKYEIFPDLWLKNWQKKSVFCIFSWFFG